MAGLTRITACPFLGYQPRLNRFGSLGPCVHGCAAPRRELREAITIAQRRRRRPSYSAAGTILIGLLAALTLSHQARPRRPSILPAESAFFTKMSPYAQKAAQATGMPVSVFLTQWALESDWGTSQAFRKDDNAAGIIPWSQARAGRDPAYAGYGSLAAFEKGVVAFYKDNRRYHDLLRAAHKGASPSRLLRMIGQTGYATAPNYGVALEAVLQTIQTIASADGQHAKIKGPRPAKRP